MSEVNNGGEHHVELVEAGNDPSEAFESMEKRFHLVAAAIGVAVVFPQIESSGVGPHHGHVAGGSTAKALARAATVRVIGQMYRPRDPAALVYTMEVTAGLALHTARAMRLDVQPMVVWGRARGHIPGGTDSFVRLWEQLGHTTTLVWPPPPTAEVRPASLLTNPESTVPFKATAHRCERAMLRREVKTMLFADIVGYSKLNWRRSVTNWPRASACSPRPS